MHICSQRTYCKCSCLCVCLSVSASQYKPVTRSESNVSGKTSFSGHIAIVVFLCSCRRTGAVNRVTLYSLMVNVRTVCAYHVCCVCYVTIWLHPITCRVSITVVRLWSRLERGDRFCQNYTVSDFMTTIQGVSSGYGRTQRSCFYNCLLKTPQKFKINSVFIAYLLYLCYFLSARFSRKIHC
jgi:hypothetical protein